MMQVTKSVATEESSQPEADLVEFLLEETDDQLFAVVHYTTDTWDVVDTDSDGEERFTKWTEGLPSDVEAERFDQFREGGGADRRRESMLDTGIDHCSLHLCADRAVRRFGRDEEGVILGCDANSARHRTYFVSLCRPSVQDVLTER